MTVYETRPTVYKKTRPDPQKLTAELAYFTKQAWREVDSGAVGVFTHMNVTQMMVFPSLVVMSRYWRSIL
jgi:hypothetical protein